MPDRKANLRTAEVHIIHGEWIQKPNTIAMDEFMGIVIVLFIVLTVFVAFVCRLMSCWKKYHLIRHKRVKLTSVWPLKDGDVLLFVAHTHGLSNSLFTYDLYSHSGVVVVIDGRHRLSEATNGSTLMADPESGDEIAIPNHATLNPLLARLKYYTGATYLMSLSRPLDESKRSILRSRAQETLPYPSMKDLLMAVVGISVHHRARHCMQHVAWLIDVMGLAPVAYKDKTLLSTGMFGSSRAVSTLPLQDLGAGYHYRPIVELLYDLDAR